MCERAKCIQRLLEGPSKDSGSSGQRRLAAHRGHWEMAASKWSSPCSQALSLHCGEAALPPLGLCHVAVAPAFSVSLCPCRGAGVDASISCRAQVCPCVGFSRYLWQKCFVLMFDIHSSCCFFLFDTRRDCGFSYIDSVPRCGGLGTQGVGCQARRWATVCVRVFLRFVIWLKQGRYITD